MAMTIRECSEGCGNLTVQAGPCEECQDDTPHMPARRRAGVDKARAFRAGVYEGETEYAGVN